ncbi:MAG: Oxygen-independent coproporphyrinogen-III oxidase-like protein [Chlamydiae bacterium]|nr:Oxygen-independent coproporphyrinogen-III oxidase-like protein [Chlamydiota bacterium]
MSSHSEISLYFHFPFCTHKCPYCHFFVLPNRAAYRESFLPALLKEWELRLPLIEGRKIVSLYFGGGTPTLFIEGIEAILERIRPNCEITVEANPEDVTHDLISHLKNLGVNRLSIGVQSLDNTLLKHLGRNHSAADAHLAAHTAHRAGIENITIDLMYELPHQTLESWKETVERACRLPITHLSLYNLVFEPHTLFHKKQSSYAPHLPSPEESTEMLHYACDHFEKVGLCRYEISAFGRPSIHNSGYWRGREFLGYGPSAFSYMEGKRFRNVRNLNKYIKRVEEGAPPVDFEERLSPLASLHERLAIGLRLLEGIEMEELPPSTEKLLYEIEEEGLIIYKKPHISLTERGLLFYDTVAEMLVLLD